MEPEDLHGWLYYSSTPEHRTNILPLRWFANACNHLSSYPLHKALRYEIKYENQETMPKAGYRWWKIYRILDAPYRKWGTSYSIDWSIDV